MESRSIHLGARPSCTARGVVLPAACRGARGKLEHHLGDHMLVIVSEDGLPEDGEGAVVGPGEGDGGGGKGTWSRWPGGGAPPGRARPSLHGRRVIGLWLTKWSIGGRQRYFQTPRHAPKGCWLGGGRSTGLRATLPPHCTATATDPRNKCTPVSPFCRRGAWKRRLTTGCGPPLD